MILIYDKRTEFCIETKIHINKEEKIVEINIKK